MCTVRGGSGNDLINRFLKRVVGIQETTFVPCRLNVREKVFFNNVENPENRSENSPKHIFFSSNAREGRGHLARGIALQSSCWFSAISFITRRIRPQVARVVCSVELRSRVVWFEAHLLKLCPIGPICRYVPFHQWRLSLQLFVR